MGGRVEGIIKSWNYERGFGFAEVGEFPHDYDVFIHISECGDYEPSKCDVVTFVVGKGKDGRNCALMVKDTGSCVEASHFDRRVSKGRYEEARKNSLRYERGCTCQQDMEKLDYGDYLYGGKCWYCNEMDD
jgi:cold shock CspA family protein